MIKNENIMEIFAERLKDLLDERGMDYQKLSAVTEIPRRTINSWILKDRSPRLDSLVILATFFGVSVDYLLGLED